MILLYAGIMLGSTEPSILCIASTNLANIEVRDYYFSGIRRRGTKADRSREGHVNSRERELSMRNPDTNCCTLAHMLSFGTFFFNCKM